MITIPQVAQISDMHLLLERSFKYRLIRWLFETGHPLQLRGGYIPDLIFDQHQDDPLARAKLLLQAMTETDLVPLCGLTLKAWFTHCAVTTILMMCSAVHIDDRGHGCFAECGAPCN
jgi:hypothetical protein